MKHKIKRLLSLLLSLTMLTAALPTSIWAEETGFAQATGAEAELPNEPEETAEPEPPTELPEATDEPELPSEPTELPPETEIPEGTAEPTPQVPEEPLPTPEPEAAYQAGVFVLVTENTRVFSDVDETADEVDGELYDGSFVRTANVRVEEVRQDGMGRTWLLVRYLYGEEEPDGEMAWTDTATVWVMAEETQPSDAADYDVTAYAFPFTPVELYAANNPPRLQTLSGNTGEFYAGQTVYAYSVHDDVQIASLKNYGAIYATRHYINEHVVYCLEHTMNSPGIRNNPDGPYHVVDLAQYGQTQGYSGIIYSEKTMHAIGWVLRHTFPFMGIDRYEDECLEWSRAAGQFAIREVIKQLEGSQYVRDYWRMDDFYRATGQAPKEYLEYACWLAANALTYAQMTGEITVSNVSVSVANGVCTGTATLTTDAPRIRIRRSVGTITGYTGGEDGTYVYLNSGDTITVSQAGSGFSFTAESVSTEELEANFLVAVPDANVQKVVIPQRGSPYPLKSTEIRFNMPNGALVVTKTDAASGAVLAGAAIKDRQGNVLFKKGDTVVDVLTTAGEDASAATGELWPGLYEIVELTPPKGYHPSEKHIFVDTVSAAGQSEEAVVEYEGLKTNTIRLGAQAIVKILGDDHDDPAPDRVEQPEAGAEFNVYLKSAGSYENARPFERDHLVTNKRGYAKTKALPYGIYVLEQTKGKEGYEIKGAIEFEIDGTEDIQNPPPLTLSDRPILCRLRILKTDRETGKTITLAHTSFKLKDANGETVRQTVHYPTEKEIDTFTTDETGGVTLPETLRWGLYYIEEISAPEGYLIQTESLPVMIGHDGDEPGQTYELNIEMQDEPVKGQILVKKTGDMLVGFETVDAYGYAVQKPVYEQRNLAGAVFELRAAEEIVGRDGTAWYAEGELVDTIITTAGGEDASKLLPLGRYTLTEVKAPEGYAPDDAPREIELAYADDQTPLVQIRVEVGNTYLPAAITLHKEAEVIRTTEANGEVLRTLHSESGEGFVFGLFSERDIHENGVTLLADTLVAVGTTDENGRLTFDGTFPHGDYYVRELQAKTGWKLNPNRFPITLEPDGDAVIRVELAQPIYDELVYTPVTLTKTDITGAKTVPGAQIEVRNEQGEMIYRATTDANGEIPDIPVTPGTYAFREILAPSGYALNEAETRFTVDEQGNVTGNTMLRDDYTRVQLRKQDENGVPLSGVEFALVTETGMRLTTAVSDANGLVTFEKIPYGRYTVEETQPLPGYFKAAVHVRLTVDGTFVNPNEPLETVTNTPMRLAYKKVDTSGRPLAGVEFSLINAATNVVTEVATSDENGEFIFRHIDYGDWIIRETAAPNGYRRMEDMLLHIGEDFVQPEPITLVNVPSSYMFMKMDGDGNPLSSVKFVLEDANGNVLREMESSEDGTVLLENLDDGQYVVRETEALQGYVKTEDTLTFTIDESYVVPEEMPCLVNEKEDEKHDIQTSVDIELTPMMTEGAALLLLAGIILIGRRLADRKRRKK